MPAQQVPDSIMWSLINRGLSGAAISRTLRDEYGYEMSRSGVSAWRKRHDLPPVYGENPQRARLIPWTVAEQHKDHQLYRFLMTEARVRNGEVPHRADLARRNVVLNELRRRPTMRIYYDREDGFRLVPGRPCDTDVIWDPRLV